jgi:hypothetical protein
MNFERPPCEAGRRAALTPAPTIQTLPSRDRHLATVHGSSRLVRFCPRPGGVGPSAVWGFVGHLCVAKTLASRVIPLLRRKSKFRQMVAIVTDRC